MQHEWEINPEWPADCSGITGYFAFEPKPTSQRILISVAGWQFFVGCGITEYTDLFEFPSGDAIVIAKGCPYIVSPGNQRVIAPNPVCDGIVRATFCEGFDVLVTTVLWSSVWAFDTNGRKWRDNEFMMDDLEVFEPRGDQFVIAGFDSSIQCSFKLGLDIETGQRSSLKTS